MSYTVMIIINKEVMNFHTTNLLLKFFKILNFVGFAGTFFVYKFIIFRVKSFVKIKSSIKVN